MRGQVEGDSLPLPLARSLHHHHIYLPPSLNLRSSQAAKPLPERSFDSASYPQNTMAEAAREVGLQGRPLFQDLQLHRPSSRQVVGFIGLLTTGSFLLLVAGLTIAGIIFTLILLAPMLIFFSPVLVPAGFALSLGMGGVFTASTAIVFTISAIAWVYNYVQGQHPPGAEQIEYARARLQDTAEQVRSKAKDFVGSVQRKAQEAAPGA